MPSAYPFQTQILIVFLDDFLHFAVEQGLSSRLSHCLLGMQMKKKRRLKTKVNKLRMMRFGFEGLNK